jgi:hypothetical protein
VDLLPIKDSVMAVTDENYFDWPVLPEAPSSLNFSVAGTTVKLDWELHGGPRTAVAVERTVDEAGSAGAKWNRIAKLSADATQFSDSTLKKGEHFAYRVRALHDAGESAYSNIARGALSTKP